jgi:anti-anti-sigma factor
MLAVPALGRSRALSPAGFDGGERPLTEVSGRDRAVTAATEEGRMSGDAAIGSAPPFRVRVQKTDGETVVVASGELDLATTGELRSCLTELRGGDHPIRLDMTDVEFMDSSGLHTLIRATEDFAAAGSRFVIVPSEPVRRVLEMVDLQDRLPIERHAGRSGPRHPRPSGSRATSGK